jgi:uncharacterized cupredoxin-like copper-binding protein
MIQKLVAVSILTFILAGCGTPVPSTEHTLLETDFAFGPPSISVPLGKPVTLTFVNNGAVEHDFAIEEIEATDITSQTEDDHMHDMGEAEYDLHIMTLPGQTNVLTFTPTRAGRYEFVCTVKGHKEAGMIGTMTVVAE